jgi:hypothetical protein
MAFSSSSSSFSVVGSDLASETVSVFEIDSSEGTDVFVSSTSFFLKLKK